jgi:type VI protein secretion system component VasA
VHPFREPIYPSSEKLSDHQLFAHLKSKVLDARDCLDSLRTILSLYQNGFWAHRLVSLSIKPLFRRHPSLQHESFCQGSEVRLEVDDFQLNQSLYLFGSVLSHFFFQTVVVNSFVHFILVGKQSGEVGRWMQNF